MEEQFSLGNFIRDLFGERSFNVIVPWMKKHEAILSGSSLLNFFHSDFTVLLPWMKKNEALLSNWPLLNFFHSEKFYTPEIDIFVQGNIEQMDEYAAELKELGYFIHPEVSVHLFEGIKPKVNGCLNIARLAGEWLPTVLQIICVECPPIASVHGFDYSINQIYWNPETPLIVTALHIDDIMNRSVQIVNVQHQSKGGGRKQKYEERGYTFHSDVKSMRERK